eukprot:NODE_816_length_3944_cov_0.511573.p1 type:complete len:244 gc:universal NODE_816_length_3944_cov_0.511573:1954-2685(+)
MFQGISCLFRGAFLMHNVHFIPMLNEFFPDHGICHLRYGIVPESQFPGSLVDALDTYTFLLGHYKIQPQNIIFFADSAGGNILLNLMQSMRDNNLPNPKCVVMISPWSDLSCPGASWVTHKNIDFLDKDLQINSLLSLYSGCDLDKDEHVLLHPYFSPCHGDLSNFPPLLIQSAVNEAIFDDNIVLYQKLKQAGNAVVEHHIFEKMTHAFQCYPFYESMYAFESIKHFVNKCDIQGRNDNIVF